MNPQYQTFFTPNMYVYVIICQHIQLSHAKASQILTAMKHSGEAHSAPLRYSATVRGAEVEAILNPARITENVDAQICMIRDQCSQHGPIITWCVFIET